MNKKVKYIFIAVMILVPGLAFAHCEIPCGIYDDDARLSEIKEHITTIAKSMDSINELSDAEKKDFNQIVRWVNNKEDHANHIQELVYQYFMTQRVKPVDKANKEEHDKYLKKLELLHNMLIFSMKSKQSTDRVIVDKLNVLLDEFKSIYNK